MRVAIYARCSTTEQHPENQVHTLREYAKLRGWEVVKEYVDEGYSGRTDKRPALAQMRADSRRHAFQCVLASRIDRIARSVTDLCAIAGEWSDLNIALCFADASVDTSTSTGRFTYNILAALAEFESALISSRTIAGLEGARRRGVKLGGRKPRLDESGLRRARRLRASGSSIRRIAELLEVSVGCAHAAVRGAA